MSVNFVPLKNHKLALFYAMVRGEQAQAIIWSNNDNAYMRIYASAGLNALTMAWYQ